MYRDLEKFRNVSISFIMTINTSNITINNNEQFNPANFPNAMSELATLRSGISDISIYFKVEIIVSYLKNHTLSIAWIDANPALTRMVTSGFFKTSHLESLFESGRDNKFFLKNFEEYIGRQLLTGRS
jgi:hypothetical protein